jgi:hypothetical protein
VYPDSSLSNDRCAQGTGVEDCEDVDNFIDMFIKKERNQGVSGISGLECDPDYADALDFLADLPSNASEFL